MRANEQLRRELKEARDNLAEVEQREAYSRDKLSAEITRLQIQVNKLNAQGYNKDETMIGLQAVNPVVRQVNSSMAFKRGPKISRREEEIEVGSMSVHSKEEYQKLPRRYNRSINEDSHNSINEWKMHEVEDKLENKEVKQERKRDEESVKHKVEDREKIIKNIENKLLSLQIEKKTVSI